MWKTNVGIRTLKDSNIFKKYRPPAWLISCCIKHVRLRYSIFRNLPSRQSNAVQLDNYICPAWHLYEFVVACWALAIAWVSVSITHGEKFRFPEKSTPPLSKSGKPCYELWRHSSEGPLWLRCQYINCIGIITEPFTSWHLRPSSSLRWGSHIQRWSKSVLLARMGG